MKKNKTRLFTMLLAVMMCLCVFPTTAFANGGENSEATSPVVTDKPTPVTVPLTPDGNLTLVDDIKGEESKDKQFVTLQSKNGNYFYLVIDRSGDKENVYFLNLVDEADLMTLIEDKDKKSEAPKICNCSEKCEAGHVKNDCTVCMSDLNQCAGKVTAPIETTPEKKSNTGNLLLILIFAGGLGVGVFYFFKALKNKPKTKGNTEPLDYDYDEDEDENENNPVEEEYETEDNTESEDDAK
ncbi:MAG: cell surface protein [Firmicutes bacterium HGW-Firmicutes-17]|nr:MAG: cell surface protein [Firmicutes bacterium HGW-Firmicutes-17]